jgi:hypothetical protein
MANAQKDHQEKKARMQAILERAQKRLGSKWMISWLSYFWGLMENRQIISNETLDVLEKSLNLYIQMQGVSPTGQPVREVINEKIKSE